MNQKIQNFFFITIIILLAVGGYFIYSQQMIINVLKRNFPITSPIPFASTSPVQLEAKKEIKQQAPLTGEEAKRMKEEISAQTTELIGKVTEINKNYLTIQTEVIDLDKINKANSTDIKTYPKILETFYVIVNNETEITPKKISDIATGTQIRIFLNKSAYSKDAIIARSIIYPYIISDHDIKPGIKFINGNVIKVEGDNVTLKSVDSNSLKEITYFVKINDKTRIVRSDFSNPPNETMIKFNDIKEGNIVTVLTEEPFGEKTEVQARDFIVKELPPASKNSVSSSTKEIKKQ